MMTLNDDQFPLTAMGVYIYGRMWSSPILTAATDEIAARTAAELNELRAIKNKVRAGGPLLVTDSGL